MSGATLVSLSPPLKTKKVLLEELVNEIYRDPLPFHRSLHWSYLLAE
jgi:hypothetical protein